LDRLVFGREKTKEEDLCGFGIYMKDRNLISGDKDIFKIGYTGGKITALLAYLLEKKEIDAAIVSHWGEASPFPWFAWPVIATNRKELIKGAGSKYVFSPVLKALKEVALRDDIERVAIVGLGCHLQGLRKLQYLGQPYSRLVDKITVKFGLYCGAPMVRKQDFMKYVSDLCNVPAEEILHVDFKRVSEAF
jgi:coenzyme F420 hydrogenase subunit beta